MRHAILAILLAAFAMPAMAQDVPEITVFPRGDAYVGPYGRDLPGVSMFSGREAPPPPLFAEGGVRLPTYQKVENEYTYSNPLPPLDAWQGTLGPGFPF